MISDQEIRELIDRRKRIVKKEPVRGFKEENGQKRCDLDLEAISDAELKFEVFIRQNIRFIENFSFGLRYLNPGKLPASFVLVRYNGPHGDYSYQSDGHFARPHIHRITANEIESGTSQPKEKLIESTDRYSTFEEALVKFFEDIGAGNYTQYFEGTMQGRLFDGY